MPSNPVLLCSCRYFNGAFPVLPAASAARQVPSESFSSKSGSAKYDFEIRFEDVGEHRQFLAQMTLPILSVSFGDASDGKTGTQVGGGIERVLRAMLPPFDTTSTSTDSPAKSCAEGTRISNKQ